MCPRNILSQLSKSKQYKTSEIGAILYNININNSPYSTQTLALMAYKCLDYLYKNRLIHYWWKGNQKLWYIV